LANIKSQIKRNRQNDKRRLTNRVYRGEARIAVKNARTAIDSSASQTKEELRKAISALDKAAEKGVLHKNNAARRKSRLMKAFNGMKPVEVKAPVEEPKPEVAAVAEPKPRRSTRAKVEKKPEPPVVEKTKAKTTTRKTASSKATTSKAATSKKPEKTGPAEAPKKTTTTRKKAPAKK
jgi:small subunit ribosomal protein S20